MSDIEALQGMALFVDPILLLKLKIENETIIYDNLSSYTLHWVNKFLLKISNIHNDDIKNLVLRSTIRLKSSYLGNLPFT